MTNRLMLFAALAIVAIAPAHAQAPAADTILVNGKVITLDGAASIVEAIAIRDGKILAVGSNESASAPIRARSASISAAARRSLA